MCRIAGYVGRSAEDFKTLFDAFSKASGCDPHLNKAGINFTAHKDGWGYVLLDQNGLHHYRSALPVYEDKVTMPVPSGNYFAILHSRLGSDQTLNGHVCAHPFAGSTDQAFIFFAHNGGIECGDLPKRMVDSEWAFKKILEAGNVESVLPLLREKTKPNAALNLLVLTIPRDPTVATTLQYLNFHKSQTSGREGYYQMYNADMPGGKAVFSSTIADLKPAGASHIRKTEFDKLQTL